MDLDKEYITNKLNENPFICNIIGTIYGLVYGIISFISFNVIKYILPINNIFYEFIIVFNIGFFVIPIFYSIKNNYNKIAYVYVVSLLVSLLLNFILY